MSKLNPEPLSTSWKLTIGIYMFAMILITAEVFLPIEIDDTKANMITNLIITMTGSTTAGGVFNSIYKHKYEIQKSIATLKSSIPK